MHLIWNHILVSANLAIVVILTGSLLYSHFVKNMEKENRRKVVPRVCIIGGKAAPGYEIAKKIIKLCHAVAETINSDAEIGDLLKLVRQRHWMFEH